MRLSFLKAPVSHSSSIPISDPAALLASLLATSGDCIKILDLDGRLLFMTETGQKVMEINDFSKFQGCPWPSFWEDQGNIDAKAAIATALTGRNGQFQGFATTAAGTPKWWEVIVTPILGTDGKPERLLSVSRDITAAHQANIALRESEARFKMFAQAMPNQIWSAMPDGQLDWFNDQTLAFTGLTIEDLAGDRWAQVIHPDDLGRASEAWTAALLEGNSYQVEFRVRRADGIFRWHIARAVPIKDASGVVERWIGSNTDIEDQKATALALDDSRQRVEAAIRAADIGTWDLDPSTGRINWDNRCYELFGMIPGTPVDFDVFLAALNPLDREATEKACLDAMHFDGPQGYDVEYRTIGLKDGKERWISAKGKAIFENGIATQFLGTVRDISKLKHAELQQKLLARELEHRLKNTMAMVSAIASQTFRTAATKEDARTIFDARLFALNRAHDILTRSSWTSASMPTVVDGALAPHRDERIRTSGPAVELTAKQALSLALALHELATNATKYGALSVPSGTISCEWTYVNSSTGPILNFCWREYGGPTVVPPTRRGFGSRLIQSTLSSDFGDAVTIEFLPEGLVCSFSTCLSGSVGRTRDS